MQLQTSVATARRPRRRSGWRTAPVLALLLLQPLLGGCGQKGPLSLPTPPAASTPGAATAASSAAPASAPR